MPDDTIVADEDRVWVASQRRLIWLRFRGHKLAMAGLVIVALFYLVAIFGDFLATTDPQASNGAQSLMPPQGIHLFDNGGFSPHVDRLRAVRDPVTLRLTYA